MTYQSEFLADRCAQIAVQACVAKRRPDQVQALALELAVADQAKTHETGTPMTADHLKQQAAWLLSNP